MTTLMNRRLIFITATFAAIGAMGLNSARADLAYAYAEQSVTFRVTVGSGSITAGTQTLSSATSAVVDPPGTSVSHLGTNDALQSYIGSAAPPENTFTQLGLVNPNYAHGDTQISATGIFGTGFTAQSVAEAYVIAPNPAAANSDGNWLLRQNFTVSDAATFLHFNYDWNNKLVGTIVGNGTADGEYKLDITVNDITSGIVLVYSNSITELNHTFASPPNFSLTTGDTNHQFDTGNSFQAGHTYQLLISGDTGVSVRAVPEPSSFALIGIGLAGAVGLLHRRKREQAAI